MKSTAILIPARWHSKRFPGKMMTDLGGIPMIRRVYDICASTGLKTYVLTDHKDIFNAMPNAIPDGRDKTKGVWSVMTDEFNPLNGTERCSLAVDNIRAFDKFDQFINVQGDMPDVTPEMILKTRMLLDIYPVTTLYADMDPKLQNDPNTVKMITNGSTAQWFGRGFTYGYHHLGIYGYNAGPLVSYHKIDPTEYEAAENLEQLRWYKGGLQIGVHKVKWSGIEINTPEDARKWNESNNV